MAVDLTNAYLKRADLRNTNFNDVDIINANLSRAILVNTTFTQVDLADSDLSAAVLIGANLKESNFADSCLQYADLSNADLTNTNLTNVDLRDADLSGANLRGATFTGAILREATIEGVSMNGSTTCHSLAEGYGYDADRSIKTRYIRQVFNTRPRWWPSVGSSDLDASQWDGTARAYHNLKSAFNDHGLVSKARHQHLRERGARRCETWAAGDKGGWLRSWIAWQLTGYGVSIRRILRNMGIVFGIATLAYLAVELIRPDHAINQEYANVPEILYYSVITFTTTPPVMPDSTGIKAIVMTEALLGTLLVVFLGYVLGTRQQF